MGEYNIIRPLSTEEKKDTIELGVGTEGILIKFLKELAKKQSEYDRRRRPFDGYSAKIDFETSMRNKIDEIANIVDETLINTKIDFGNLDRYGELSRFEFTEKTPCNVNKTIYGIKTEVVIGQRYKFRCKQRGNKISIVIDNEKIEDFEKWLKENNFIKEEPVEEATVQVVEEKVVEKSKK